jgi:Restriction endonuclease
MRLLMSGTMEKGRRLEAEIAGFLHLQGYFCRRNVVAAGRSGASHEVDVLAEKSDGLITFRVMVECKNWHSAIAKETVIKADYVARDLGLNKAIVASVGGCASGAEIAAAELGVELWGPSEIARHLGNLSLSELRSTGAPTTARLAFRAGAPVELADRLIAREARGMLGLGREQVPQTVTTWIPAFLMALSVARVEGRVRPKLRSNCVWTLHEALEGCCLHRWSEDPLPGPVEIEGLVLPPLLRSRAVTSQLTKAAQRLHDVRQPTARERHASALVELGVLTPEQSKSEATGRRFRDLSVDRVVDVLWPTRIGVLERRGQRRVVAICAVTGRRSDAISRVLTSRLGHLEAALARYDGSRRLAAGS